MMDTLAQTLSILVNMFALIAGSLTGLWAYSKYALERGILPPVQFYVTSNMLGTKDNQKILNIQVHIHNLGSATLVAQNIRLDVRYMNTTDQNIGLFSDQSKAGRLIFPHSIIQDMEIDPSNLIPLKFKSDQKKSQFLEQKKYLKRGFLVSRHDTFIQAGVDQGYTFVTKVPKDTICILVWCSFQYAQSLSSLQRLFFTISRKLGLIQYHLKHAQEPHTVESAFWLPDDTNWLSTESQYGTKTEKSERF